MYNVPGINSEQNIAIANIQYLLHFLTSFDNHLTE
jgi:hypothetical protein